MQLRKILYLSVSLTATPFDSFAATTESVSRDELFNMPLQELLKQTITASTLTEETQQTVPASVTVFTREQITPMGINTLEELLNYVPGFQSFRQADAGNEYYHSARGRRTGTSSREVLVLIDGQRFNHEWSAGTGVPVIPLGNIEKVEVIRGPGSAIYGSNAFTGVISITTVKNKNEAMLSHGNNNTSQGQLLSSSKLDDITVDFYANAFHDDGETYTLQDSTTLDSFSSNDPGKGYDFNLKIGNTKSQLNVIHDDQMANNFYLIETSSNQYNEDRFIYDSVAFRQNIDWSRSIDTNYSLRYYNWSGYYNVPVLPVFLSKTTKSTNKEYGIEFDIDNDWTINTKHSVQFGLEQRHIDNPKLELRTDMGDLLLTKSNNRDVTGIYLQNLYALNNDTNITLGARYDDYSRIGSAFSPRAGVVYQVSAIQTVKLLYGKAFRAPTVAEPLLTSNGGTIATPNLDPETIETWELVWMGDWQNNTLTITGFDNHIVDSIIQDDVNGSRFYVNSNSPENSQGIEFEYIGELTPEWQLRGQYSFFNKLPDSAFRQADELASAIINYHKNQWNLNLSGTYNNEREMTIDTQNNRLSLGGYWLLNSKLQYALTPTQSLYLQGKNLTDKDYLTPTQGTNLTEGIPNRGREISVGFLWQFQ